MSSLRRPRPTDAGWARRTVGAAWATRPTAPGFTAATTGGTAAATSDAALAGNDRSGPAALAERLSVEASPSNDSAASVVSLAAGPASAVTAGGSDEAGPAVVSDA